MKQSGGHIRIYSETGVGTTIKMYFPRLTGKTDIPAWIAREPAPTMAPSLDGTETVLVVEDDPQVNKLAVEALQERGYQRVVRAGRCLGAAADRRRRSDRSHADRRRVAGRHERASADR